MNSDKLSAARFIISLAIIIFLSVWLYCAKPENSWEWISSKVHVFAFLVALSLTTFFLKKVITYSRITLLFFSAVKLWRILAKIMRMVSFENHNLLFKFFKSYIEHEKSNISGTRSLLYNSIKTNVKTSKETNIYVMKNYIITDFLAYSEHVTNLIDAAKKICPKGKEVVCFTTLTIPLSKWFNFQELPIINLIDRKFNYYSIHPLWQLYTNNIKTLLSSENHPIIYRFILSIKDDKISNTPFSTVGNLKNHCNYWMLSEKNYHEKFSCLEREHICKNYAPGTYKIKNYINNYCHKIKNSDEYYSENVYLIIPNGDLKLSDLPHPKDNLKWARLGSIFIDLFHSNENHCKYRVIDENEWLKYYVCKNKSIPEDFFMIAFRQKNSVDLPTEWLMGLAANVDENLDKLRLEFISADFNKERCNHLNDYISYIFSDTNSKLLKNLVNVAR